MNEANITITQQEARHILWALGHLQDWIIDCNAPEERKTKTIGLLDNIQAKIDIAFIGK